MRLACRSLGPLGGAPLPWLALMAGVAGVAVLAGLAGCATPVEPPAPLALLAPAEAGLGEAVLPTDRAPAWPTAAWWQALGDPALDGLIEQALARQPGLQAVAARVAAAEAATASAQAATAPHANLALDVSRQRFSRNGLVPPAVAGSTRDLATLQASGRFSLDFFGRHAAALRAAIGQQRAAAAELQAARQLLTAQLVQGWVGLARLQAQAELADQGLQLGQARRALIAQRQAGGLETAMALQAAEGAEAEARQQIALIEGQTELARHSLAVLAGLAPQALASVRPQPQALPSLPARLGADLLGRRAEVVAARWRVEAAMAQVDSARAGFYPDIDLTGFVGLNALGLDRLLVLGSRQAGIGPALRLPLFDGGQLQAQLGQRAAEADAAVAAYNGAVLQAAREAVDAQAWLQSLARQQAAQARVADAAQAALALTRQRYQAGLAGRLLVLDIESTVLAQRGVAIELQFRRQGAQIALMQALGGGWLDQPPAQAGR